MYPQILGQNIETGEHINPEATHMYVNDFPVALGAKIENSALAYNVPDTVATDGLIKDIKWYFDELLDAGQYTAKREFMVVDCDASSADLGSIAVSAGKIDQFVDYKGEKGVVIFRNMDKTTGTNSEVPTPQQEHASECISKLLAKKSRRSPVIGVNPKAKEDQASPRLGTGLLAQFGVQHEFNGSMSVYDAKKSLTAREISDEQAEQAISELPTSRNGTTTTYSDFVPVFHSLVRGGFRPVGKRAT